MYIQIKTADCSQTKRVEVSKLTSVEDLKLLVQHVLDVRPERQRLFFRGKQVEETVFIFREMFLSRLLLCIHDLKFTSQQLEEGSRVIDYNINLNDVVMLMIKPDLAALPDSSNVSEIQDSQHCHPSTTPETVSDYAHPNCHARKC